MKTTLTLCFVALAAAACVLAGPSRAESAATTPQPKPAWAWTPFEVTQVLYLSGPQWGTVPDREHHRGLPRDVIEQVSCTPIGKPVWLGHYADFKCSGTYRHWVTGGLTDWPPQPITLYVANSRVGLGSACVSAEALPTSCPGRPAPKANDPAGPLTTRLGSYLPYYACASRPNRNGAYGCVYTNRQRQTVIATVKLKPQSVALQLSALPYRDAVCKVAPSSGSGCS